jgi:hypothetical protein
MSGRDAVQEQEDLIAGIRAAEEELQEAIDSYNSSLAAQRDNVEEKLYALNLKISEAERWAEDVGVVDFSAEFVSIDDFPAETIDVPECSVAEHLETLYVPECSVADDPEDFPDILD